MRTLLVVSVLAMAGSAFAGPERGMDAPKALGEAAAGQVAPAAVPTTAIAPVEGLGSGELTGALSGPAAAESPAAAQAPAAAEAVRFRADSWGGSGLRQAAAERRAELMLGRMGAAEAKLDAGQDASGELNKDFDNSGQRGEDAAAAAGSESAAGRLAKAQVRDRAAAQDVPAAQPEVSLGRRVKNGANGVFFGLTVGSIAGAAGLVLASAGTLVTWPALLAGMAAFALPMAAVSGLGGFYSHTEWGDRLRRMSAAAWLGAVLGFLFGLLPLNVGADALGLISLASAMKMTAGAAAVGFVVSGYLEWSGRKAAQRASLNSLLGGALGVATALALTLLAMSLGQVPGLSSAGVLILSGLGAIPGALIALRADPVGSMSGALDEEAPIRRGMQFLPKSVTIEDGVDADVAAGLKAGLLAAGPMPEDVRIVIEEHMDPQMPLVRVYAHGGSDMFYLHQLPDLIRELSYGRFDPRRYLGARKTFPLDFAKHGKMFGDYARAVAKLRKS